MKTSKFKTGIVLKTEIEIVRDILQKKADGHKLNFAERNIVNMHNKKKLKK